MLVTEREPKFPECCLGLKSTDYTSFAHHHVGIHFKNKDGSINACIHTYTHKETNKKTGKICNKIYRCLQLKLLLIFISPLPVAPLPHFFFLI